MYDRETEVPQPFPGKPRLPRLAERKDVVIGDLPMLENPVTGSDVPTGIAIAQEGGDALHLEDHVKRGKQEDQVCQRREQSNGPAIRTGAAPDGRLRRIVQRD